MGTIHKYLLFSLICLGISCSKSPDVSQQGEQVEITFSPTFTVVTVPAKAGLYDGDNLISADHKGDF